MAGIDGEQQVIVDDRSTVVVDVVDAPTRQEHHQAPRRRVIPVLGRHGVPVVAKPGEIAQVGVLDGAPLKELRATQRRVLPP
jgi:hypothetical protein